MNARLKELAQRGGMPLDKVQALIDHAGGDERWVESILQNATTTEKAAMLSGVTYKADAQAFDEYDEGDEDSDLTLSNGDLDAIKKLIVGVLGRQQAPAKARILTDSGPQSVLPTTKAYNPQHDPIARAIGADQDQRPWAATKAATVSLEALVKGYSWDGR